MGPAESVIIAVEAWLGCGLLVALPFAFFGAGRIDHGAKDGSWLFKLLILPGATLLWPVVAWKWATHRAEAKP